MVNAENFNDRLSDARSILNFAEDSFKYVNRIYDLVNQNAEFFNASPGQDNLYLAVMKLETLVDQWRHDNAKVEL